MSPNSQQARIIRRSLGMLLLLGIVALTHDIVITNILAFQICRSEPQPKTFIKKTVEYPESIYWEDNIYPGFDAKDRLLMIRNYLDGVHLTTMALNAPNGTIYVFTATPDDWRESSAIKAGEKEGDYFEMVKIETKQIAERGKTMDKASRPNLNFSVVFNPVPLSPFKSRFLYSDEVIIKQTKQNTIIAFNQRLMRFYYNIEVKPIGGCISLTMLHYDSVFGYPSQYHFDDKVLFKNYKTSNIFKNFECKKSFIENK